MIHIVTRDHKHKEAPTELVARRTPVDDMKIPDPMDQAMVLPRPNFNCWKNNRG